MPSVVEDKIYCNFYACHIKDRHSDSYPVHFHENIEIYLPISGSKSCLIDNKLYEINPGDILIFKSDQIHRIIRDDNVEFERYVISFKPSFLLEYFSREEFYVINNILTGNDTIIFSPKDEEKEEFYKLFSEYEKANILNPDPTFFHSTHRTIKFIEMITYVFVVFQKHKNSVQKSLKRNYLINPILDYIENNFITANLDSIAKHFSLNKNYLCTLFKKNTSITLNNYIISKKIIHAKKILAEGKNVTETAELCGFSDSTDFVRVFKKYTNLSPKKYQMSLKLWK